jgi:hypothetical protein
LYRTQCYPKGHLNGGDHPAREKVCRKLQEFFKQLFACTSIASDSFRPA